MWEFVVQGGPIMVPLLISSVISLAVILERYIFFRRTQNNNQKLFKKYSRYIRRNQFKEAIRDLKKERGPVARVMASGLTIIGGTGKNDLEEHLNLAGEQEVAKMEKNLMVLDVIASVSPLLGLLGTVLGIIDSFDILHLTGGVASPAQLSSGIARALLTTATGLFIAIPTMVFYSHFIGILNRRVRDLNRWTKEVQGLLEDVNIHV